MLSSHWLKDECFSELLIGLILTRVSCLNQWLDKLFQIRPLQLSWSTTRNKLAAWFTVLMKEREIRNRIMKIFRYFTATLYSQLDKSTIGVSIQSCLKVQLYFIVKIGHVSCFNCTSMILQWFNCDIKKSSSEEAFWMTGWYRLCRQSY